MDLQKAFKNKIFKKDIFKNKKLLLKKKRVNSYFIKIFEKLNLKKINNVQIYEIDSSSINSINYILKLKDKDFVLKVEKFSDNKNINLNLIKLLKKSSKNLISMPISFYISDDKKTIFSLFKFYKGNYFCGDFKSIMIIINKLHKLFLKNKYKYKFEKNNYFSKKQEKSLIYFNKNKNKFNKILKKYYKEFSLDVFNYLSCECSRLSALYKFKIFKNKYIFHNDLHPHNILINKKGRLKFIDYRSYKLVNLEISLSYCLLKLIRHMIAEKKSNKLILENCDYIILKIKKKFNFFKFSPNVKIADLAKIEILRRIIVIFDNISLRNYKINYILPVLINNMFEAEKIFMNKKYIN